MERIPRLRRRRLPPVLSSESTEEQSAMYEELARDIKPNDSMEREFFTDIVSITFEIHRLRRAKVGIINIAFRQALQGLLSQLLREPSLHVDAVPDEVERLVRGWYTGRNGKERVLRKLSQFQLDESAIEAEAIRIRSRDIALIEHLLDTQQRNRARALASIEAYRESLAREKSTHGIVEQGNLRQLEPTARDARSLQSIERRAR